MLNTVQQNLKIICSLDEIKKNGYKIKVSIPEEKRCPYCNRILQPKGILNPFDYTIKIFTENKECNCEKAQLNKQKKKHEIEKQLLEEAEKVRKEYINCQIKQYYGKEFITKQFKRQTMDNFITNENNKNIMIAAKKFLYEYKKNLYKSLMFVGDNYTGKTHIVTAICNELQKDDVPIIFGTLTDLLNKYKVSYQNNTSIELTKLYTKVDLLVIDDLGVENINEWMLSKLFVIINDRLNNDLPIIITTNYNIEELRKRLTISDDMCKTTDKIISRLCYMCRKVECNGSSYEIDKKM